ncbi:zinc-binding dehydrogenase [Geodermatophilus sp. DSM 44513]|uniref:zinc-binding dehydrogenase n=1 Tax=Geodermatophilus sp. DSM 44513 TaxID=1528104 RepID=UPI00127A3BFA|nr:zinc-binding dehydrogenase [Geodermatophilus sp. DSM 44513]WNV73846.1 zinc-binding dehydrogenase [Geodermatophilus sp. DSM 44513]
MTDAGPAPARPDRPGGAGMWAQRLVAPQQLEQVEVPAPREAALGPGEVLVALGAGGICGSDLPFFRGGLSPDAPADAREFGTPGFPMHEVAGTAVASRHPDIGVGDAVVGWAPRFDGLAELVVCDGDGLHAHDRRLPARTAVLLQPLACVLYAMEQVRPVAGRSVAVIGQGPIGLLFAHVAKAAGATRVVGVDRVDRSGTAAAFGVDDPVRAASDLWATSLTDAERPDLVVEAAGHQTATLTHAVQAVAPGGEVFYFGVPDELVYPLPMRLMLRKNLTLRCGVTWERRRVLARAEEYLGAHPELAECYVSHVFPADDAQSAYEHAAHPAPGQVKVVVAAS